MQRIADALYRPIAMFERRGASRELKKYGLLYEDLFHNDIAEQARSMMPRELQVARRRRINRAFDLSFKRQYMPEEFQRNWDPMRVYLAPYYEEVEKLQEEREILKRS